jgi:hypothetical protein
MIPNVNTPNCLIAGGNVKLLDRDRRYLVQTHLSTSLFVALHTVSTYRSAVPPPKSANCDQVSPSRLCNPANRLDRVEPYLHTGG